MKNYILFVLFWSLTCTMLNGQDVYRHETTSENTSRYFTKLNHTQLNGHPEAIVFIMPNWNRNGVGLTGMDCDQNAGVWYDTRESVWTIFNQDTTHEMKNGVTFNVLIAPPRDNHYFKVKATQESIVANAFNNGFVIDHLATNRDTDAFILVTQNRDTAFNDNAPIVQFANGKWRISNNRYFIIGNHSKMPPGAQFNVMVIEKDKVPGFTNSKAFKHIADENNTPQSILKNRTILNIPFINGNSNAVIFATPYWGHGDQDRNRYDSSKAGGPYNESPIITRYYPKVKYNKTWSLINANKDTIPTRPHGAKFFVAAVEEKKSNCIVTLYGETYYHGQSICFNQSTEITNMPLWTSKSLIVKPGYIAEITTYCDAEFPTTISFVGNNPNINLYNICKIKISPIAGRRTIALPDITNRCPQRHYRGDQDFNGHGPIMYCQANLYPTPLNELKLDVFFSAIETGNTESAVDDRWTTTVFTAPPGMRIITIGDSFSGSTPVAPPLGTGVESRPAGFEVSNGCLLCNEGQIHTSGRDFPLQGHLIRKLILVGDTGGKDIKDCCRCDTRIKSMQFNPVTIFLVRQN